MIIHRLYRSRRLLRRHRHPDLFQEQ